MPSVSIEGPPVAAGQAQEVFFHPLDRDLLVKVNKPGPAPRRFFQRWKVLSTVRQAYKNLVPLVRELREYDRMNASGETFSRHLQRF
jgi:hypothetical protein